jgi:hypothetical protein
MRLEGERGPVPNDDLLYTIPLNILKNSKYVGSFGKPLIKQELVCPAPRFALHFQQLRDNSFSSCANIQFFLPTILPASNFPIQLFFIHASKRKTPTQHHKQQYSTGPHIDMPAFVASFACYLGSHIGWCSTISVELPFVHNTKTEVDQLYLVEFIHQNILQFDVSMADAVAMAARNSL